MSLCITLTVQNFLPFGGAAVTAFTRAWVAATADGGIALGISVTGCSWRPPGKKEPTLHLLPYN